MQGHSAGGDGFEIIYGLRNNDTLSKKIASEIENTGQNVRKYYQRRLPSDSSKDYYYIIRNTPDTEAILIEYGFLDSPGDDVNQLKNNWKTYAEAVVKAVSSYIGVPYYSDTDEYYTVKSGDSLWSIAKKFNTTVDNLKKINNLTSNLLSIGQKLKISEGTTSSNNKYYTVQKGDTLYSIANKYGLTVNELKKLNNLTSDNLSVGQSLIVEKLPSESTNVNTYVVKSGDTLYSIAKKFNTTVSNLMTLNNLTSSTLSLNQVLKVPTGETSTSNNYYTVKSGDTLYSIASKYGLTVDELKKLNNLTSNTLSIGQQLKVNTNQSSSTDSNIYTVKSGDTLYSIAKKYNTTVTDILDKNNLSTSNLSIGQKLIIP